MSESIWKRLSTPPAEGVVAINFYRICIGITIILASVLCLGGLSMLSSQNDLHAAILLVPGGLLFIFAYLVVLLVQKAKLPIDSQTHYSFQRVPQNRTRNVRPITS